MAEGPYLGPVEFAAGVVELTSAVAAQTAALELPLVAGPASIVGAVTAGDATIVGVLNTMLNSIRSLAPAIPFPTGPQLLSNGGAARLNTNTVWTTWAIALSPNDRPWPAILDHDFRLHVLSGGVVSVLTCRFVTLPVIQGTICVATVSTNTNGRYILWRT